MRSALLVVTAIAIGVGGCAAVTAGGSGGSSDVITLEQIEAASGSTAYEIIREIRPRFLTSRGAVRLSADADPSDTEPVVYVDGVRFGELDSLHNLQKSDLMEIRRLSSGDATTRFGTGHVGGAILVTT
ncbi:MAG: hypothetical protein ACOC8B_08695, partial [Gemmatimonadota bacterium]